MIIGKIMAKFVDKNLYTREKLGWRGEIYEIFRRRLREHVPPLGRFCSRLQIFI